MVLRCELCFDTLEKHMDQRSSKSGRSPSAGASSSASRVKPDPGRSAAKRDRRDAGDGDGDATEGEKSRDLLSIEELCQQPPTNQPMKQRSKQRSKQATNQPANRNKNKRGLTWFNPPKDGFDAGGHGFI